MLKKIVVIFIWLSFGYLLLGNQLSYIHSGGIDYLGMNKNSIELVIKFMIFSLFIMFYTYFVRKKVSHKILNVFIYILIIIVGLGLLNRGDSPNRIQTIGITNNTKEIKTLIVKKVYFADNELNYILKPGDKIQFRILGSSIQKIDNSVLNISIINNGKVDTFFETKVEDLFKGNSPETELTIR